MAEDSITKGIKSLIGGAAAAGGAAKVIDLLESIETKMAHLEKMMTGSLGGWDMKRVRDVQFQTYHRSDAWPDRILCAVGRTAGLPYTLTLNPRGIARIVSVTLSMRADSISGAFCDCTVMTPIPTDLLRLDVSPMSPFAQISFDMPYPSQFFLIPPNILFDRVPIQFVTQTINPADVAILSVYYIDHIDNL